MSAQPQTQGPNLGMQPTTFDNPMGIAASSSWNSPRRKQGEA